MAAPIQRHDETATIVPTEDRMVRLAVRAIAVHWPQEWPSGVVCANDREPYPCETRRWADDVIKYSRLNSREVMAAATAYRSR